MSTQEFLQEAQYIHNVFVVGFTLGVGVFIAIVVEYFRRKDG